MTPLKPAGRTAYGEGMRGRIALSFAGLMLTLIGLVLGVLAAVHGELSTTETLGGAVVVALVAAVCGSGIRNRSRLLRHERDEPEA